MKSVRQSVSRQNYEHRKERQRTDRKTKIKREPPTIEKGSSFTDRVRSLLAGDRNGYGGGRWQGCCRCTPAGGQLPTGNLRFGSYCSGLLAGISYR